MSGEKKPGRPSDGEKREKLNKISFWCDAETQAALDFLIEIEEAAHVIRPRGHAIRKAIQTAAELARRGKRE